MVATIREMGIHTYEHLNIANIIRESKISRGSFYQYFEDKTDLYNYFYTYISEKKIQFFGDIFSIDYDIPFLERFYQLYVKGFAFAKQNPEMVKAGKKVVASEHFLSSNRMTQSIEQATDLFVAFIKKDQELGRIKKSVDPKLLASFLLEFTNKVTFEDYFKDEMDSEIIELKIRQLVEMLQKGIE